MSNPDPPSDRFAGAFMADYFAECDEHLTAIRRILLDAERRSRGFSAPAVEELFRSFHSLKGLSGMVELREAEVVAHHMESFLRALRGRERDVSAHAIATLIEGTHALEHVITARREEQPAPPIDHIVAEFEALSSSVGSSEQPTPVAPATGDGNQIQPPRARWQIVFTPSPELAARGIGVDRVRALLRDAGDIVEAVPRVGSDGSVRFEFLVEGAFDDVDPAEWAEQGLTMQGVDVVPRAEGSTPSPGVSTGTPTSTLLTPSHFVRVDLARLDDLMRMIGDLVITRARLGDTLARLERHVPAAQWRAVQDNSLAIERQLRDLREGVMRVRLVPVGEIFRRMPFVVRDLARESGKNVHLEIRGQDTEIDKFLIERMLDPVLHLVRNAVSHGIESPPERLAVGKPEAATITLSAASVGDVVIIEVADDGRGVDAGAVMARARRLGLPVPDGPLTPDTLLDILCAPGFSTRDEVDRASGRGVGMAVVQTTIQELGGRLSLDTAPGQGTRFVLELPVTLVITDAIIARVGRETFAVAQSAIREVIEVAPADVRSLEHGEIAAYRGAALPLVRLANAFGLEPSPGRALHVFVIGHGASAVGLAVDRIVGQREIVVRALADPLVKVDEVVGATDLGDGRAVLILDAQRFASRRRARNDI